MFPFFAALAWRTRYQLGAVWTFAALLALCAIAEAQEVTVAQVSPTAAPAATPSPAPPLPGGRGSEAPAATIPKAAPAKFGHFPIIDIVPWYTEPLFYSSSPKIGKNGQPTTNALKNAGVGYDPLDVGGTIKIPLTPNIAFSFDRNIEGTVNVPNARVTNAEHAYIYNTFARDVVLVSRLDEQFHRLQIEEGLYFRHRIVGGANTSNNPFPPTTSSTEAHFGYVGLTYAFAPIDFLGGSFFTVNINADTQAIDHHVGCAPGAKAFTSGSFSAPCVNGVFNPNPSQDRVWETDQYVAFTVPFDRKRGFIFSAQDRWGALNFYENAAFPYRWTSSQTYFLTKRFNRVFALSLRTRSQWSVAQGVPYLKPNSQHNGTVDVLADFKIDTNNLH
jgi:hypothetical protein